MKQQYFPALALSILFFACGCKDNFSGRWIGNCGGYPDTFIITKDWVGYSIKKTGLDMDAKLSGDTLEADNLTILFWSGPKLKFIYNNASGQLEFLEGKVRCPYDKK